MPDVLIPPPQTDETKKVVEDEINVAFKFAFRAARRVKNSRKLYKLGYRRVAVINTAQQDLNSINLENKLCLVKEERKSSRGSHSSFPREK